MFTQEPKILPAGQPFLRPRRILHTARLSRRQFDATVSRLMRKLKLNRVQATAKAIGLIRFRKSKAA